MRKNSIVFFFLLWIVKVWGHLRFPEVKTLKSGKHVISSYEDRLLFMFTCGYSQVIRQNVLSLEEVIIKWGQRGKNMKPLLTFCKQSQKGNIEGSHIYSVNAPYWWLATYFYCCRLKVIFAHQRFNGENLVNMVSHEGWTWCCNCSQLWCQCVLKNVKP